MGVLTKRSIIFGAVLCVVMTRQVAAQDLKIGVTAIAKNEVTGTLHRDIRRLKVSDGVFFNELIHTGPKGNTQFLFLDETVLTIGPESELVLNNMVYDPATNVGEMVVNITQGIFRFVSGTMPSTSYRIDTPISSIGIRGTAFDMIVDAEGQTTVIVEEGEVSMSVIETGQSVIVPAGQASTIEEKSARPSKPRQTPAAVIKLVKTVLAGQASTTEEKSTRPSKPRQTPAAIIKQIKTALSESVTQVQGTGGGVTSTTDSPVSAQIISESADAVGQAGSQGSHQTP